MDGGVSARASTMGFLGPGVGTCDQDSVNSGGRRSPIVMRRLRRAYLAIAAILVCGCGDPGITIGVRNDASIPVDVQFNRGTERLVYVIPPHSSGVVATWFG